MGVDIREKTLWYLAVGRIGDDPDRMAEHLAHTQDWARTQSTRDSNDSKCSIVPSSVCISECGSFLVWDVRRHS